MDGRTGALDLPGRRGATARRSTAATASSSRATGWPRPGCCREVAWASAVEAARGALALAGATAGLRSVA